MPEYQVDIESRDLLSDGYLKLERQRLRHSRFDGGMTPTVEREVCLRGLAVGVLLYDPQCDEVVLIEQFRAGAAAGGGPAWLTEIVAGMVGRGETTEQVAAREAWEEAGATITALEPICTYFPSPGILSEKVVVFCGRIDSSTVAAFGGLPEEHEDIRVMRVGAEAAFAMLDSDQLNNSVTIIAVSWLARHHARLRAKWRDHT